MKLPSSKRVVIYMRNYTGAVSLLGQLVQVHASSTANSFKYEAATKATTNVVGVVGLGGIPFENCEYVPIIVSGIAQVAFANDQPAVRGTFATLDPDQDGYAGYPAALSSGQGIGMVLTTGADQYAWVALSISKTKDISG